VISEALLRRVACPVCLENAGCAECGREGAGHAACGAEYALRVRCACGGPDKRVLQAVDASLVCPCCRASYPLHAGEGYLDLRPRTAVGRVTLYADHDFHEHFHAVDGPPVLSARVKADMMWRWLSPGAGQTVLDLGSGPGKLALYAASDGARATGIDVAPFFLGRAAREVDLVLGDLRRLPFRKSTFESAYSLDVLEHFDEAEVVDVLVEARRSVGAAGRLFVYTHAMESSRLAVFQRGVNRLARRLGRAGLLDHEREAMRKSDHKNPIRDHEHFDSLCAATGWRVAERRYYNVVLKAVVEDLLLRLVQHARRRRPASSGSHGPGGEAALPGRLALGIALALTWLLKLDVVLFGGIRTGPFFGLLRPIASTPDPVAR